MTEKRSTNRTPVLLSLVFTVAVVPTTIAAVYVLDSGFEAIVAAYLGAGLFVISAAVFVVLRNAEQRISEDQRAYLHQLYSAARQGSLYPSFTYKPDIRSPRDYNTDEVRLMLAEPLRLVADAGLRGRLDDRFVSYYDSYIQAGDTDRQPALILLASEFGFTPPQIAVALDVDRHVVLTSLESQLRRVADNLHKQATMDSEPGDDSTIDNEDYPF